MSRLDIVNSFISLILYLVQISWLIYGNYLYFNLPLDVPGVYNDHTRKTEASMDAIDPAEINAEKWLYIALMTVLTIGYVHLMTFIALIVIFIVYTIG